MNQICTAMFQVRMYQNIGQPLQSTSVTSFQNNIRNTLNVTQQAKIVQSITGLMDGMHHMKTQAGKATIQNIRGSMESNSQRGEQ
jgi:hypothetical protein